MYWISRKDQGLNIALRKKRLRDFKPKEGCEYYVRTKRKPPEFLDFVPVYVGKNGKLVKTNAVSTGWFKSSN
tara:strand:+ start:2521 stop:2736 length:216 start_codon:yes stop_codon:yes gene_type:complete